jgi:hypothetical protein
MHMSNQPTDSTIPFTSIASRLDGALLARPGNVDIQLDLFLDYANNVKLSQISGILPRLAAAAARHLGPERHLLHPRGRRSVPSRHPVRTVELLDTGHFALETHLKEITAAMRRFLAIHITWTYGHFAQARGTLCASRSAESSSARAEQTRLPLADSRHTSP